MFIDVGLHIISSWTLECILLILMLQYDDCDDDDARIVK